MTEILDDAVNWADLPDLLGQPGHTMRRFTGADVMLQVATMPKGGSFTPHSHANEQLVMMLEGRLRLDIFDTRTDAPRSVVLGPGDLVRLAPNVPHGGEALEDARILDAFSPPRTTILGEEEPA